MSKNRYVENKTTNLKTKVKHVEKESNEEIVRELSKRIYTQRFKKYFVLPLIQQFIIWNARSRSFKRVKDQLSHININYLYRFVTTTWIAIENVDLVWESTL